MVYSLSYCQNSEAIDREKMGKSEIEVNLGVRVIKRLGLACKTINIQLKRGFIINHRKYDNGSRH